MVYFLGASIALSMTCILLQTGFKAALALDVKVIQTPLSIFHS